MDKLVMKYEGKDPEAWGETIVVEMPNQPVKLAIFKLKRIWYLERIKHLNESVATELFKYPKLTTTEKEETAKKLYYLGFKQLNKRMSELKFTKQYRVVNGKRK